MKSDQEELHYYTFTWEKFGNHLRKFVEENSHKLMDIDIILSFKRGGSIFGQALVCMIQDFFGKNSKKIRIRDIPSKMIYKNTKPTFLNRFVASPAEINDIPKLKEELMKEIQKKSKDNEKINIVVIDDNITTCLRQTLISKLIEEWFGKHVRVQKFAFCCQTGKEESLNEIVVKDPEIKDKIVRMPWHELRKITRKIKQKNEIKRILFEYNHHFDSEDFYEICNTYKDIIYEILGLRGIIDPKNRNIFKIKYCKKMDKIEIFTGLFTYNIVFIENYLYVFLSGPSIIPKLCEKEKFFIDEPEYRLCNSIYREDGSCFICTYLYCSRDIFYLILQFLKKNGMKKEHLTDITIEFNHNEVDSSITDYILKYFKQLYQEEEMPKIYEVKK